MINNTIDYLVLLAITFLLVIVFIYSFAVCFLISIPVLKARRWQNNPNKNKKTTQLSFPNF